MFKSLKTKLILSFIGITSINMIVIIGNEIYKNKKESIDVVIQELNNAQLQHLNDIKSFDDFLFLDAQKNEFYVSRKSIYLQKHDSLFKQTKMTINKIVTSSQIKRLDIYTQLTDLSVKLDTFNSITLKIAKYIELRGFKDFGNTGKMREHAHNLEKINEFPLAYILTLRRNEKDFMIREEIKYAELFMENHKKYINYVVNAQNISPQTKKTIFYEMEQYKKSFEKLIHYTNIIGDKTNTGLYGNLTRTTHSLQNDFTQLISNTEHSKKHFYAQIRLYYIILLVAIIISGLIISYIIANAITKPIAGLSTGMNHFIKSGFQKQNDLKLKTTTAEISKLIESYSILKSGIIDLIVNFKQKVEERTQEIETQNQLLKKQKEETEQINKNIYTGLTYAKYIQSSLLPDITYFKELFPESFIYHRPKDIVSGDFYWAKRFLNIEGEDLSVLAVADATGHGVSGALMSMLGITFLDDITPRTNIKHAGEVITLLRDTITGVLNNKENSNQSNNGIDIGLFVLNNKTLQLEFSGANRFIWILRENEIIELKGDKLPIGGHVSEKIYNDYNFNLKKGDNIYLFTDGYTDQFGGDENRKFMKNRFKDLLIEVGKLPAESQKNIIGEIHTKWKGNTDQTDDILVIGIKI